MNLSSSPNMPSSAAKSVTNFESLRQGYIASLVLFIVELLDVLTAHTTFSGANSAALNHYRLMDIKQVQCDTVSHLILSRGSTFSLAATGDIGMMQECIAASDIYTQNSSDTVDMIVRAFQYEKYSQITEFVEFEDRLDNSLQRDLTRLEYVRMKFTTEKLEPEALILELQELEFVLEKVHHDNRDFSIIPNYQPRGHQLAEQTTMGVVRGFQWLTVFLQLYIRAYARACKVETTAGSDLSTFRMSWLSEMTEDEKAFLEFSQILHEWIPCPPLQSRDAALAAVGAVVIHPENGDAGQERKTSPPPPHVKQDGSEPLKVEASADSAIAFFSRAEERVRSLVSEGTLLWEILHVATLAQEAFILLQIVSLPWVPRSGKGKKPSDHPQIVQSLKSVNSQAAKHLQEISTLLTQFAEAEGSEDKHQVWADGCSALGNVNPALDRDFALNVAKTSLEARCSVSGGIGKGILKILATHQGTPS
ncbi:hypothetical protein FRB99_004016 [Tulasnella sp. 403]|nr:hypothetical protein FRB99_004016 [Tulasnella sp. 403]